MEGHMHSFAAQAESFLELVACCTICNREHTYFDDSFTCDCGAHCTWQPDDELFCVEDEDA